jgi:hypothetical protein
MDPVRFDRLSKRVALRVSRRRAVRGLGAAGIAGTFFALRRSSAAADCPDIYLYCGIPSRGGNMNPIGAAGTYGQCWNWSTGCELCPGAREAAVRRCNETWPEKCNGQCIPWSP